MEVMTPDPSFEAVLADLRQRDNDAATQVYKRFVRRLIGLARSHLDERMLQRVDPEDVAQSAMKSVMHRLAEGQFVLGDWDGMWGLLTRITINKCHKWVDYYQAQARQLDREQAPRRDSDSSSGWEFLDREPTPSEASMLAETLERSLKDLDEREREMVMLSLDGYTVAEVSGRLDCTESKVYRVLRLIRQRLERMRDQDD